MTEANGKENRLDRIERILAETAERAAANTLGIQQLRQSIAEEQRLISDLRTQQAQTDAKMEQLVKQQIEQQAKAEVREARVDGKFEALTEIIANIAAIDKAKHAQHEEMIERLDMLIENMIRRSEPNGSES